jgi:serine/threonine-protein kinase
VKDKDLSEPTALEDEGGAGTESSVDTVAAKRSAIPASAADAVTKITGPDAVETHPHSHRGGTLTPEQALLADEIARTRLFLKVCAVLATSLMCATPLLSGSVMMRIGVAACAAVVVVAVLIFAWVLRKDSGYTQARWLAVSYTMMFSTCIGMYFVGIFSPAPMVGTLGIYFLCLGSSLGLALTAYLTGALLHAIPAVLIAFGITSDLGLFSSPNTTTQDKLVAALLVQIVYALTFLLARGSRRATRNAVERLHQALAQVQKREALLAEAHLDLDRALKAGFAGRYTDRRLGPFVLGEIIGRGAMSEVYRAKHVESGLAAAVKVLQRDLVVEQAQVRRFLREANIVSGLKSPHVVRVLSFGNFDAPLSGRVESDDPPYIAMELLEGHDLAWHLRKERRLAPARLLELVDQVADALSEAERAEIVHRDLKPQNLFCAQAGEGPRSWKVLDFGVSKLSTGSGTLTKGHIVGTPGYMAPEQARGAEVDPRADVFALAVIAYRALTGRPAFAGKEMPKVLFDICYVQPVQPSKLLQIPDDVERVLALGLAKKPENRIQTAREFAAALRAAFDGNLDVELRRRATAMLTAMPWGYRPTA